MSEDLDRLKRAVAKMRGHAREADLRIEESKRRYWIAEGRKQVYREWIEQERKRLAALPWFLRWLA